MTRLILTQDLMQSIREHGEQFYPEEGAGLILGHHDDHERRAVRLVPLRNTFESGERYHRYMIDARDMMAAEDLADELNLDLIGIFHSHPDHPAEPSEFDRQWALPWYSYVITRIEAGAAKESRCWRLAEDRAAFVEEDLNTHDV